MAVDKDAARDTPSCMESNHEPENPDIPPKNASSNGVVGHKDVKKNAFEALLDSWGVDKICGIDDATLQNAIDADMMKARRRASIVSTLKEVDVVDPFQNHAPTLLGKPLVQVEVKEKHPRKAKSRAIGITLEAEATRNDANGLFTQESSRREVAAEGREDEFVLTTTTSNPKSHDDYNVTTSPRTETADDVSETLCEREMPADRLDSDEMDEKIVIDSSKLLSARAISAEQSVLSQEKFGVTFKARAATTLHS